MDAGEGSTTVRVVVELVDPRQVGPHPHLRVVDALARLQLAARQAGCTIRLQAPPTELAELLDLAGLADLVVGTPTADAADPPEGCPDAGRA